MTSLRARMMFTLLAGLLSGGIAGAVGLYFQSIEELDELFDERLRALGDRLRPETLARDSPQGDPEEHDDIVVQLWSRDGQLLFRSSTEERAPAPSVSGFSSAPDDDDIWRSYAHRTAEGGFLQVAQELSERQEMAAASAFHLLLPLLAVLPLIAVFTAWTVSRQLRPLRVLAEQLRSRGALTQSVIVVPQAPVELAPVVAALNQLLARQAEAAHQQRDFLADAAHELRTPLAVVSLQAQRAQQVIDPVERREALDALKRGVERATRLVTQLLALARTEPGAADVGAMTGLAPIDFEILLKTVLAELYPLAAEKQIDLGLTESRRCEIQGDAEDLRSLIVNLVDNAIRFTPSGGRVDVALKVADRRASLIVSDTGPGIPPERRRLVFERFVRHGTADIGGTGLGLAIARQVAERHGGSIVLEDGDAGCGLRARVSLPLAA